MMSAADLLSTVLDLLSGMGVLRHRRMFGGIYIYCDDLFIATIHDGRLYFKANANTSSEFIARKLPIFSYPKEGGIATLQHYQAPPEVFESRQAMQLWANKALLAAQQDANSKNLQRKRSASVREKNNKRSPKR